MRNQNIYTTRVSNGLIVGARGNAKPLLPNIQRAFAVTVQNSTESAEEFSIEHRKSAAGRSGVVSAVRARRESGRDGSAAVERFALDLRHIHPAARVGQGERPGDRRRVQRSDTARERRASGNRRPQSRHYQPDITNPDITNPDITNPDITNAEVYNPDITNPDITNPAIRNPVVKNPDITNPDITNPDITNPDITNPDITNPDITNVVTANPDITNPDITNPDITNPDITNPDITNPDITNPDITNKAITDASWVITNKGNTTASYDVKLLLNGKVPDDLRTQLSFTRSTRRQSPRRIQSRASPPAILVSRRRTSSS